MIGSYVPLLTPPARLDEPVLWFAFRKAEILVLGGAETPAMPCCFDLTEHGVTVERSQYLGLYGGKHCYAVAVLETQPLPEGWAALGLRDLFGLPRAQDLAFADPLHLVPAANAFPRTSFVIPHFGAGLFREALLAGTQCANVHLDTSSSNSWMRASEARLALREVFERALGALGPERILFGTDSGTFPAGWRRDRYDEQHATVSGLGCSPADLDRVFRGNAQALLRLD